MRFLFVKQSLAWPRSSGHDVYCYYLQRELARLGHEVSLLTADEPAPEAVAGLHLKLRRTFATAGPDDGRPLRLSRLQERYRSYWGIPPERIRAVARVAEECQADAVVVAGLEVLPYLGAVQGRCRIWYPADEWVWHHLSQVRLFDRSTWGELKDAVVKGLYERAYGPLLDRIWVVSDRDRRAMRWVSGVRGVEVLCYGVDGDHYRPAEGEQVPDSCAFWGRLDFGPNLQGLQWFCGRVWPLVRREAPAARFTIYGFHPTQAVQALAGRDGVTLVPNLPDLRPEVGRHQAAVMPFVSG